MPDMPRLRGLLHLHALWLAVPLAVVLVSLAPDGGARLAAAVYGVGLIALFTASALYHRWRWNPRWKPLLRRIDHSTIFLFIAASYTPVAALVLEPPMSVVVLVSVWAAALGGVVLSVAWIEAPRALQALCYIGVGWVALVALPELAGSLGAWPVALLAVGGALYSAGAVVYATQRPDPWPATYGFHEVFHTLVVLAAAVHYVAMAGWVVPGGSPS
jgi:hemolysin III